MGDLLDDGLRVVDLCSGTGLFSHAFELEGFKVVAGFEVDRDKAEAWGRNHPGADVHATDILQVRARDILRYGDPNRLVIIGGIPCQGYSTANQYRSMDNTLRDHVLRLVSEVEPAAVALENVLEGWHGHRVEPVVDADVGGVTIRKRGFYGCPPVEQTHAQTPRLRLDGRQLKPWRGWGEVIEGPDVAADMTQQHDWKVRKKLWVRHNNEPMWTVTSKLDVAFFETDRRKTLRWSTVEDFRRLQGFPEKWHLPPQKTKQLSAIGDAVPLAMGRAVARAVASRRVEVVA